MKKLRNKKTGDIGFLICVVGPSPEKIKVVECIDGKCGSKCWYYDTITELNEKWEYYEEPKDNNYWYIDDFGRIQFSSEVLDEIGEHPNNWMARKLFGNYFETKEEAEKAVEKLKAWKRLKDKGFSIYSWDYEFDMVDKPAQTIILRASAVDSSNTDLDLLFGGEE